MPIHRHNLEHLKIHSFNQTPPAERQNASPAALIIVCHGIYQQATRTTRVPKAPLVYFPFTRTSEPVDLTCTIRS